MDSKLFLQGLSRLKALFVPKIPAVRREFLRTPAGGLATIVDTKYGGNSSIYVVVDERGERSVWKTNEHSKERMPFMQNERRINNRLADMQMSGVVRMLYAGEFTEQVWLQFEYAGDSLNTCKPSYVRAAKLATSLCETVARCNESGIIHRDIKPANLFQPRYAFNTAEVLVGDFDIAIDKQHPLRERPGYFTGTLAYLAPESVFPSTFDLKKPAYDDAPSIASTLYELAVGMTPYGLVPSRADIMSSIRTNTLAWPQNPRYGEFVKIVDHLYQRNPKNRLSVRSAVDAFGEFASRLPVGEENRT